jgi:hypothetical protein
MVKLAAMLVDPHCTLEVIISEAEGSPIVHTGIILDNGRMVYAQYGEGVVCREVDTSDPTRWLVLDLPWPMNPDCEEWWEATIGDGYNWVGCLLSAIRGKGLTYAGEWFCSQHSAELISRLTGGPKSLPPLACPAELVRRIRGLLSPALCESFQPQNIQPMADYLREAFGVHDMARKWQGKVVRA